MFSSDFNPLLSVLQKYTDDKGNVVWDALINEIKSMASLFAGNRAEMPRTGTAMEEMMKNMAKSQGEEISWKAAVGDNPIKYAF